MRPADRQLRRQRDHYPLDPKVTVFGIDFASLPTALNGLLFVLGGVAIWFAGARLALYADALAELTGIGRAFLGMVLLAGITDLPECVTSISAIAGGNAPLAVNNLFGGIVMQTAILAVADASFGRNPLSFFTPKPELLLQGVLLIILLAVVLAGIEAGDHALFAGIGIWTSIVFGLYLASIWMVAHFEAGKHWRPVDFPDALSESIKTHQLKKQKPSLSLSRLLLAIAASSLVVLATGALLVSTAEALAVQTNLGSSFVGATLLAGTTSLPELSTTIGAVRLRAYSMAFANIFGSNAIMVVLLFATDAIHSEGPILNSVDSSAAFAAAMGIVVTGVYLTGLIMRRHKAFLRMGFDSWIVLSIYALTIVGLYVLRAG